MSLEELRAQIEAEEQEAEQPEVEETEQEEQPESETEESEEAELSDDFELELVGEPEPDQQKKPSAEDALLHKLTKQKKRAQAAESEVETLRKELEQLKQSLSKPQPLPTSHAGEPKFPDMYDAGIDGDRDKYSKAVAKYLADMSQYNSRHAEAEQAQATQKQRMEDVTKRLAVRAAKFATDNKVNIDRVADALNVATDAIDSAVNLDGALAWLLDSVGDGGERVGYHLGTNENARTQLIGLLKDDPSGIKAAAHMARLADKLKPKQSRQISKAPEPDQPVKGDSIASASAKKLQNMWDKETDVLKLAALRRRARELGVTLTN